MDETEKKERIDSLGRFHNYMQSMLSEEQRKDFQRLGEKLYGSFDLNKGEIFKKNEDDKVIKLEEALAYIIESLKSGLHPRYLNEDEIHLLKAAYGDEWYKLWNYTKEEIK